MNALLVRPPPVSGESRQGYLLRLSEHNALGTPLRIKVEWLDELSRGVCLRGPIAGLGALNSPDPLGLSARYWNSRRPRYCPQCLDEAPYWRSAWGLVFYVACHHHGVALADDCSDCERPLSWKRGKFLQCTCGADLRRRSPQVASAHALAVSHALAVAWQEGSSSSTTEAGQIDVEGLLYRTWLLGSYQSQAAERAQKLEGLYAMTQATRIVEAAADVVSGPRSAYFDFLDQVAIRYGAPSSTRLVSRFGAFYTELFGSRAPDALADLREGFEAYVRERWSGQIAKRNRRLSPALRTDHAWVPITRAAKQLHWKSTRLRRWIACGAVRGQLELRPSGRTAGVVHRDDLARLVADSRSWVDLTAACKVLRRGKKAVHELVARGDLSPVSGPTIDGAASWRFRQTDVDARSAPLPSLRTSSTQ